MEDKSQDARYAPPQSHVEDVVPPGGAQPGELASRGTRFLSAMLDAGISIAAIWLLATFTPINLWEDDGLGMWEPRISSAASGVVLYLVLHGYLLATRGQTIGKALFKIRIARPDGSRAQIGRILALRDGPLFFTSIWPLLGPIYVLIDCLFIFRASRRCLHDQIADTVVLQA
ncbi:RDD family protein [Variovorax sp. SG517]|uniref:RDD family protein n=1 Tax=unclassified Variovorax TaxID=663243 RepID=UPI00159E4BD8|nr:RDD family protein [Variovorax sp. SG517]NVM92560.1 putative RDD family membrane protein YckC [Variovorax sp. SG517]